jgi:DNA-binding GntR family transcriptional regulator
MPGDKISIEQLKTDLGVSRTPIVIVLKMLEREMLIKTKPRVGPIKSNSTRNKKRRSYEEIKKIFS